MTRSVRAADLRLKRAYEPPGRNDGRRILVDRLWPRGISHDRARLDLWLQDIAPSAGLRTWWNHDPDRLEEFAHRYETELDTNQALKELRAVIAAHPSVTLLYGAHSPSVNHAAVLARYLQGDQGSDAADE